MKKIVFIFGLLMFTAPLFAQEFLQYEFLTNAFRGTVRTIDINNDGKMDVVVVGENNLDGKKSIIVENSGVTFNENDLTIGGFVDHGLGAKDEVTPSGIPEGVWWADMKVGDIDNDGYSDIFINGGVSTHTKVFTHLYLFNMFIFSVLIVSLYH